MFNSTLRTQTRVLVNGARKRTKKRESERNPNEIEMELGKKVF